MSDLKKEKAKRIAVIDLGTNSVRFDVYDVGSDLRVHRSYRVKEMVRLGEGLFSTGYLEGQAMHRTLVVFKEFRDYLTENPVDSVIAFSTCVLREAKNAQEFIDAVQEQSGIEIKVISGQREAELISLAILSNERVPKAGSYSLVDIGGGSTELSLCYKRRVIEQDSLALGSSRLQQNFLNQVPSIPEEIASLRQHICKQLEQSFDTERWSDTQGVVGSSGTAKALVKMAEARGFQTQPLKVKDLNTIVSEIKYFTPKELRDYPGMEERRVDIILSGAVLFQEICKFLNAKEIYVTDYNLRDGILEEAIQSYI